MSKLDSFGVPVPGVTAVAVKEILPMQLASLLKLCVVINDDETAKDTVRAGQLTNGHLMHSFIDDEGNTRQAFYSCTEASHLPENIAKQIGHKRSRKEAFGSDYALQLTHFRDYAQTLTEGGSKGEKCDYLLTHINDTELRFVPVQSKLKLNKKRKAHAFAEDDEHAAQSQVKHIVIAPRGLSGDDAR